MTDLNGHGVATADGAPSLTDRVRELRLDGRADARPARSSSSGAWLPWVLCILLAAAWASMGARWYRTNPGSGVAPAPSSATPAPGDSATSAPQVRVERSPGDVAGAPKSEPDAVVLEAKGYLIPSHQISISPIDVSGRIIDLRIEEGMYFAKGKPLAAIDATAFRADVAEAEAQVAASRARWNEAQCSWALEIEQSRAELGDARAQLAEAKVTYDAARSPRSGAVANLEIAQAQKRFEATEQRVVVAEKKLMLVAGEARKMRIEALGRDLQAAEARLARARWRLNNCEITAPIDGIILTKKAEYGSLINPVVGGVSTSLCEMADLRKLEVDLEIQERDIAKIRTGMACRVRADAYPDRPYDGFFDRAMPIANRARGIVPVRVRVVIPETEKQGEYLKPEMGVSVVFINRDIDPKIKAEFERQEAEYRAITTREAGPKE